MPWSRSSRYRVTLLSRIYTIDVSKATKLLKQAQRRVQGACCWAQAFKADEVDLPRDGKIAAYATITLPDDFNSLDFLGSTFTAQ